MLRSIFNAKYLPILLLYVLLVGNVYYSMRFLTWPPLLHTILNGGVAIFIMGLSVRYFVSNRMTLWKIFPYESFMYLVLLIYAIISAICLCYESSDFDWRTNITTIGTYALFGLIFVFASQQNFKYWHRTFIRIIPVIIALYFINWEFTSTMYTYAAFYIIFWKFIPKNRRWILWLSLFTVIFFPGQRMSLLRVGLVLLLYVAFRYKLLKKWVLRFLYIVLLVVPIALFIAAAVGGFNIFTAGEDTNYTYKTGDTEEENLLVDSRTFLFTEAWDSAERYDSFLLGRGFMNGYYSPFQIRRNEEMNVMTNETGRLSEVFIINIFVQMGFLGVVLFLVLIARSAYLGINRSKNRYLPMIGVVVAMQWLFCWIENCNLVPTMDLIIMYALIMMCSSPFYRNLTDKEFEREMYDTFNYKSLKKKYNNYELTRK